MCQSQPQKPTLAIDSSNAAISPCGSPDDCTWCAYSNAKRIRRNSTASDDSSTSGSDGALSSPTESLPDAPVLQSKELDYLDQSRRSSASAVSDTSSASSGSSGSSRASDSSSDRSGHQARTARSRTRSRSGTERTANFCVTNLANLSINPNSVSDEASARSRTSRVSSLSSRLLPAMEPMETVNTTTNIPINGSINTTTDCLGKVVEPVIPDEQVAIVGSAANRREFGDLASETASAADHHDAEKSIELVTPPSGLQPGGLVSLPILCGLACLAYSFYIVLNRSRSVSLGHLGHSDYLKFLVYSHLLEYIEYSRYLRYVVPSFGLVIILTVAFVSMAVLRSLARALNTCPIIRFLVFTHLTWKLFTCGFTSSAWITLGFSCLAFRSTIAELSSFISSLSPFFILLVSLKTRPSIASFNPFDSLGLFTLFDSPNLFNASDSNNPFTALMTFDSSRRFNLFGYLHGSNTTAREFKEPKGRLRLQTSPTSPTLTSLHFTESTDSNEASEPSTPSTLRSLHYFSVPRSGEGRKALKGRAGFLGYTNVSQRLERIGSTRRSLFASFLASMQALRTFLLWAMRVLRVVLLLAVSVASVSTTCTLYALWDHSEPFVLVFVAVGCFICSRCLMGSGSSSSSKSLSGKRRLKGVARRTKVATTSTMWKTESAPRPISSVKTISTGLPRLISVVSAFTGQVLTDTLTYTLTLSRHVLACSLGSVAGCAWLLLLGDLQANMVVFRMLEAIHRFR